ncbi:MAG: macro domain-containing protein [Prevotella sp.]
MKFHWKSSKTRWKDSLTISLAILTSIQAVAEVTGMVEFESFASLLWWVKLLWLLALFAVITIVVFIVILLFTLKGISITVGDNEVQIRRADIFKQKGLKLIPFNEYFDTQVDDITIAYNSLNGKFIEEYVKDINQLRNTILNTPEVSGFQPKNINGKKQYPLGHIIKFGEYLLLAFSHFDENKTANLSHTDYEKCLIKMWKEIDRVYANTPIFIPLLGSGITRFTDTPHKDNFSLAKCLLCTLKMSGVHLKQPITICLTKDTMDEINIYELKSK